MPSGLGLPNLVSDPEASLTQPTSGILPLEDIMPWYQPSPRLSSIPVPPALGQPGAAPPHRATQTHITPVLCADFPKHFHMRQFLSSSAGFWKCSAGEERHTGEDVLHRTSHRRESTGGARPLVHRHTAARAGTHPGPAQPTARAPATGATEPPDRRKRFYMCCHQTTCVTLYVEQNVRCKTKMNEMSPFWLKSEILFVSSPRPAHTHIHARTLVHRD